MDPCFGRRACQRIILRWSRSIHATVNQKQPNLHPSFNFDDPANQKQHAGQRTQSNKMIGGDKGLEALRLNSGPVSCRKTQAWSATPGTGRVDAPETSR